MFVSNTFHIDTIKDEMYMYILN
ncbi:protein of unknown function [Xenorhabdus doucetiae]|uniref:Uncharacterized protein n=1 Tax=Xenorhabdus doucetiae TaxID=351671 RepID=A0A068QRL4_9GAMM|nr:protein of unknown function [Xenorhabdus doucetiae]